MDGFGRRLDDSMGPAVGPAGARGRRRRRSAGVAARHSLRAGGAIGSSARLGHRKKLQDFLVDRKIPREMRDSSSGGGWRRRIVWVVGESVSEDFRVTEPARGVIFLKARRLGGQVELDPEELTVLDGPRCCRGPDLEFLDGLRPSQRVGCRSRNSSSWSTTTRSPRWSWSAMKSPAR